MKVCKLIAAFLSICCCLILSRKILKKESGVFPTQERLSWLCLVINSIQGLLGLLTPFNLPGLLTPTLNHLGLQTPNNGNHSPVNPMSVLSLLCFLRASNRPVMILWPPGDFHRSPCAFNPQLKNSYKAPHHQQSQSNQIIMVHSANHILKVI